MMFGQKLNSPRIFKWLAKALIRLRVCAGWSEPLLVTHNTLLEISCRGSIKSLTCLPGRIYANTQDNVHLSGSYCIYFKFKTLHIKCNAFVNSESFHENNLYLNCLSVSANIFNYCPHAFIVTRLKTCTMYIDVKLSSKVRSKNPLRVYRYLKMRKACPWCVFISETLWKHLLNMLDISSAKTHQIQHSVCWFIVLFFFIFKLFKNTKCPNMEVWLSLFFEKIILRTHRKLFRTPVYQGRKRKLSHFKVVTLIARKLFNMGMVSTAYARIFNYVFH